MSQGWRGRKRTENLGWNYALKIDAPTVAKPMRREGEITKKSRKKVRQVNIQIG